MYRFVDLGAVRMDLGKHSPSPRLATNHSEWLTPGLAFVLLNLFARGRFTRIKIFLPSRCALKQPRCLQLGSLRKRPVQETDH